MVFPPFETHSEIDLRTKTIDIPKQSVITQDNIEVMLDAVIYLKVNKDDDLGSVLTRHEKIEISLQIYGINNFNIAI